MRVHPNQINPNAQLDAMYAAQKAAAKREAERTRKKLLELASEVAGNAKTEDFIVTLGQGDDHDDREGGARPDRHDHESKTATERAEDQDASISDWA